MPRRHTGGVEVLIHLFLNLVLDGGEWLSSRPTKNPGSHRIWGRQDPRICVDVSTSRKIFCPYREWNPGPSSHCLCPCTDYATPAHCNETYETKNMGRILFQARNDNARCAGNMEIDREEQRKGLSSTTATTCKKIFSYAFSFTPMK